MQALVHNGLVIQVEADGSQFPVAPPMEWIQTAQAVEVGWIYDGSALSAPAVPLSDVQAAKIAELETAYNDANSADIQITTAAGTTATLTATPTDRSHLHDMITSFGAGGAAPSDFTWTDTSGAEVPFTLADLKTFAKALGDRGWANTKNLRTKLKSVAALAGMSPRANSTTYALGGECTDGNGGLWKCTTAGTSGNSAPTWPSSPTTSSAVKDGGVTWTYVSTLEAAIQAVSW